MSSRRQYNMPPTEDTREALLEDTAQYALLRGPRSRVGAANAAEAVEVLCVLPPQRIERRAGARERSRRASTRACSWRRRRRSFRRCKRTRPLDLPRDAAGFCGRRQRGPLRQRGAMACWRVVAGAGVRGATPPLFALASGSRTARARPRRRLRREPLDGRLALRGHPREGDAAADITVDFVVRRRLAPLRVHLCAALFGRGALLLGEPGRGSRGAPWIDFPPQKNDSSRSWPHVFGLYFGYYGLSTWIAVLVDSAGIARVPVAIWPATRRATWSDFCSSTNRAAKTPGRRDGPVGVPGVLLS